MTCASPSGSLVAAALDSRLGPASHSMTQVRHEAVTEPVASALKPDAGTTLSRACSACAALAPGRLTLGEPGVADGSHPAPELVHGFGTPRDDGSRTARGGHRWGYGMKSADKNALDPSGIGLYLRSRGWIEQAAPRFEDDQTSAFEKLFQISLPAAATRYVSCAGVWLVSS